MKIRSITFFFDPNNTDWDAEIFRLSQFAREGREIFQKDGIEVQTIRLASRSFCEFLSLDNPRKAFEQVKDIARQSVDGGFDYLSIGPAQTHLPESYDLIPLILEETENIFMSGQMVNAQRQIHIDSVRACARVIEKAARISPDGFANLRFTALANVPAHTPFFPAAYHDDVLSGFALAVESANIAVSAIRNSENIAAAQSTIKAGLEKAAGKITSLAGEMARKWQMLFYGLDFSFAPFPSPESSLGAALELLGPQNAGEVGSLAAAAILADALDGAVFQKTGFNGLMMPVLEDSILAQRSKDGTLTLKDLMMFSAVCGTGLDTVPLPGSASADDLTGLLLDISALSLRLDKPLTARLMPIPGKQAGDLTEFNFPYFANSRVLALQAEPLTGLLAGDESFSMQWRKG
jgi:uncharacterized protein (UPF0210 family)